MEQFTLLAGDQTLKDSREQINNALLSVRSLSSGTTFPTTELSEGMLCYRTDLARLYQLVDLASQTWSDKISVSISGTASSADAAPWDGITGKPTAYPAEEHTHNYAGASTSGGSAASADKLATARTINGVAFDGTTNIEIDVGVKSVNSTAPDEDGNVAISVGVQSVDGKMPDENGNVDLNDDVVYIDAFIVESWASGTEWYRKYSDGFIEQGGYSTEDNITFSLPFSDTNYTLTAAYNRGGTTTSGNFNYIKSWTETGFTQHRDSGQCTWWHACGY